jgi:hypothetical protein
MLDDLASPSVNYFGSSDLVQTRTPRQLRQAMAKVHAAIQRLPRTVAEQLCLETARLIVKRHA